MMRNFTRRSLVAAGLSLFVAAAQAQDFPNRPITLMVGLAPGGITDVTARLYAESVSEVLVSASSSKIAPGAGGGIAAAAVQNALPNGYTLLVFSEFPARHRARDSKPPTTRSRASRRSPSCSTAWWSGGPRRRPARTPAELHAFGRKKSARLTFGTPGVGSPSHLLGAKILLKDKVPAETIYYRGGAPSMADLITGRLDFAWPTLSTSRVFIADKRLRALAIDADTRWPMLPDAPTLGELGYGNEKVAPWFALAAPAGTPSAVVNRLREMFVSASRDPDLIRRLHENGTPIATSTPEQTAKAMAQEWDEMQALAKVLNLRPQ